MTPWLTLHSFVCCFGLCQGVWLSMAWLIIIKARTHQGQLRHWESNLWVCKHLRWQWTWSQLSWLHLSAHSFIPGGPNPHLKSPMPSLIWHVPPYMSVCLILTAILNEGQKDCFLQLRPSGKKCFLNMSQPICVCGINVCNKERNSSNVSSPFPSLNCLWFPLFTISVYYLYVFIDQLRNLFLIPCYTEWGFPAPFVAPAICPLLAIFLLRWQIMCWIFVPQQMLGSDSLISTANSAVPGLPVPLLPALKRTGSWVRQQPFCSYTLEAKT